MKTKIKIIITVCAFAGVLNANASVNYEVKNSGFISTEESLSTLNEKIASFESDINGSIDYQKEAQLVTQWIADMAEAKAVQNIMDRGFVAPKETINSFENEDSNENINETTDFLEEARIMTKQIADQEEDKIVKIVMERGFDTPIEIFNSFENEFINENDDVNIDYGKEAQLLIKLIADKEEAKTVQKLIAEGKLLECK